MKLILETTQLRLREFNTGDADFILTLLNSEGWLEFIGDQKIKTIKAAKKYLIDGAITNYSKFGYGFYLVELKELNAAIGMCGLIKRKELDDVDIGFAFLTAYTQKGFAFEASLATLNYAQTKLGIKRVIAITEPHNIPCIKLLKKLGFEFEKAVKLSEQSEELLLFSDPKTNIQYK